MTVMSVCFRTINTYVGLNMFTLFSFFFFFNRKKISALSVFSLVGPVEIKEPVTKRRVIDHNIWSEPCTTVEGG